jgi:TRAP-type mannitol/chloroaromatic compound transport system substrate-binding protein
MTEKVREAYKLIEQYRNALSQAEKAPLYYASGYHTDGEPLDIIENITPWDTVQNAADVLANNKAATRLLRAVKITVEQDEGAGTMLRNADGGQIRSRDIPVFNRKKHTT